MLLRGNNYAFARQYLWCCVVVGIWLSVVGIWLSVVGIWLSVLASSQSYRQPTTDNRQPTTYNLLSIDILFLNNQTTSFVWKTVPCRCMLIAFFICFGTVFQTAPSFLSLIPRIRPGIHESGCYMAGWHNVVINMVLLANYLKHMKK